MFEIGSTLRQARERRAIGLDQAESETKIRARYLRALEDEDFHLIPGPTYVKGFLRTYADYLGLDGRLYVDEYASRFAEPRRDHDLAHLRRRAARDRRGRSGGRRESSIVLVALAGIVAVALLVIVASTYPSRGGDEGATTAAVPSVAETDAPINPLLAPAEGETAVAPDAALELVVRASAPAAVKIWRGGKTTDAPIFDGVLDPRAAGGGRSKALRSKTGFTIVTADPDLLMLLVGGVPQPLPGGSRFRVERDGTIRAIA